MERKEAIGRLKELEGLDLIKYADRYSVTVWKADKLNKGWAGHVIERYLGVALKLSAIP